MSQLDPEEKPAVDFSKLKAQYGDLVVIELEGHELAFKRVTKGHLTEMKKKINKTPDLVIDITINVCEFNCVYGVEHFKDLANRYPLAFCGNEDTKGVIDVLMDLARGGAAGPSIRVE